MPSMAWCRSSRRRQLAMGFAIRGPGVLTVVFVLVAGAGVVRADEPVLRLGDLVGVAVRQSPDLERARIDVAAARAALVQAEGIEDLHVTASATVTASHTPVTDPGG